MTINTFLKEHWKYIVLAVVLIASIYFYHDWQESRYQKATIIQQEQLQSLNEIQNRLHTTEQNASALQTELKKINTGQVQPVTNYYVSAPTVQAGAEKVQQQINSKDPALPPAVLEQTDRTVVTPDEQKQKVDVYKINLDKQWEISTGIGYHDNFYVPVEVQRNVGRNKAVSAELHVAPDGVTGGEFKTTYRF
jgi:type IV secretory pathway VirB10-like protein